MMPYSHRRHWTSIEGEKPQPETAEEREERLKRLDAFLKSSDLFGYIFFGILLMIIILGAIYQSQA